MMTQIETVNLKDLSSIRTVSKVVAFLFTLFAFLIPLNANAEALVSLQSYLSKDTISNVKIHDSDLIHEFYTARADKPLWLSGNRMSKDVQPILQLFANSWEHGLNPNNYAIGVLGEALKARRLDDPFYYEVLMSAAVVDYARDLSAMRVPPREINQLSKFWQPAPDARAVLEFVSKAKNPAPALESYAPQSKIYKRFQQELKMLIEQIEKGDPRESVLPISVPHTLHVGDRSAVVQDIRYRLGAELKDNGADPAVYDDELARAVMAYQARNGLKQDGVIGPRTVDVLNISLKDKLKKVLVNMERARWVQRDMPAKYVVVNIPAQTVWAIDDGKIAIEMPVIIGSKKRETNSFVTKVTGVRFNPTWTVPETIKFQDYLPMLMKDPNALNNKGIEFYWGHGKDSLSLPPSSIQWEFLSKDDIKAIRMVQGPGATNPLGRIRLHMPNQYNIYLHDTSTHGRFQNGDRALSSGCVRMERPEEMAMFILNPNKNWSADRMKSILDAGKMVDVWAHETTPIFLLYQTIWLDDQENLIYGYDVYSKDRELYNVMRKYDMLPFGKI